MKFGVQILIFETSPLSILQNSTGTSFSRAMITTVNIMITTILKRDEVNVE